MPPVGFEPTIPASARPHTYVVDRAATGIGIKLRNSKVTFLSAFQDNFLRNTIFVSPIRMSFKVLQIPGAIHFAQREPLSLYKSAQ
jgi:hypothetical protein